MESNLFGKTRHAKKVGDGIYGFRKDIQTDFGKICFLQSLEISLSDKMTSVELK